MHSSTCPKRGIVSKKGYLMVKQLVPATTTVYRAALFASLGNKKCDPKGRIPHQDK